MIEKCFFSLSAVSLVFAAATGNLTEMSNAVLDGASRTVTLLLALAGSMCLWSGVMEVLKEAGAIGVLARVLAPVLRRLFPEAWKSKEAGEAICAAISANILGIGNAATPLALGAMREMQKINPTPEKAGNDMVRFAVLGASSLDLLPTTIIALRRAAGSAAPYGIIVPVWICSLASSAAAIALTGLFSRIFPGRGTGGKHTRVKDGESAYSAPDESEHGSTEVTSCSAENNETCNGLLLSKSVIYGKAEEKA